MPNRSDLWPKNKAFKRNAFLHAPNLYLIRNHGCLFFSEFGFFKVRSRTPHCVNIWRVQNYRTPHFSVLFKCGNSEGCGKIWGKSEVCRSAQQCCAGCGWSLPTSLFFTLFSKTSFKSIRLVDPNFFTECVKNGCHQLK